MRKEGKKVGGVEKEALRRAHWEGEVIWESSWAKMEISR